jgi:hypothetical protein
MIDRLSQGADMNTRYTLALALLVTVALGAPLTAADTVVKGELVDSHCYMKDKKHAGAGHRDCGMTCAKKGTPVALVTGDGTIYWVTGDLTKDNNAQLVPHISHTVELTGEVTEQEGKKSIAAKSLKMAS